MITIILDWPARELSPNARTHYQVKAKFVKFHRELAYIETRNVMPEGWTPKRVDLSVIFYPPDKAHRDLDNCYSMCKSFQDGIFQALGMDDSSIEMVELRFGTPRKLGCVTFTLSDGELEY